VLLESCKEPRAGLAGFMCQAAGCWHGSRTEVDGVPLGDTGDADTEGVLDDVRVTDGVLDCTRSVGKVAAMSAL